MGSRLSCANPQWILYASGLIFRTLVGNRSVFRIRYLCCWAANSSNLKSLHPWHTGSVSISGSVVTSCFHLAMRLIYVNLESYLGKFGRIWNHTRKTGNMVIGHILRIPCTRYQLCTVEVLKVTSLNFVMHDSGETKILGDTYMDAICIILGSLYAYSGND